MDKGYSLLEVLVALLIFSLLMLLVMSVQLVVTGRQQQLAYKNTAQQHLNLAIASIRSGDKQLFIPVWQSSLADNLPAGKGLVDSLGSSLSVSWFNKLSRKMEVLHAKI